MAVDHAGPREQNQKQDANNDPHPLLQRPVFFKATARFHYFSCLIFPGSFPLALAFNNQIPQDAAMQALSVPT
jgi:hypothetical protein